jgi:hypothetical protein
MNTHKFLNLSSSLQLTLRPRSSYSYSTIFLVEQTHFVSDTSFGTRSKLEELKYMRKNRDVENKLQDL